MFTTLPLETSIARLVNLAFFNTQRDETVPAELIYILMSFTSSAASKASILATALVATCKYALQLVPTLCIPIATNQRTRRTPHL